MIHGTEERIEVPLFMPAWLVQELWVKGAFTAEEHEALLQGKSVDHKDLGRVMVGRRIPMGDVAPSIPKGVTKTHLILGPEATS